MSHNSASMHMYDWVRPRLAMNKNPCIPDTSSRSPPAKVTGRFSNLRAVGAIEPGVGRFICHIFLVNLPVRWCLLVLIESKEPNFPWTNCSQPADIDCGIGAQPLANTDSGADTLDLPLVAAKGLALFGDHECALEKWLENTNMLVRFDTKSSSSTIRSQWRIAVPNIPNSWSQLLSDGRKKAYMCGASYTGE